MDVTLSCGSSLHPVGWRSDFLELCHSPWQFWILVSKPEPGVNQVLRLQCRSLDIFSDYCFRSLRSHSNQNWFMCIFCVWKCLFCTYVCNFVMLVQLRVRFGYVWWSPKSCILLFHFYLKLTKVIHFKGTPSVDNMQNISYTFIFISFCEGKGRNVSF